jgi:hypothetical protein
MKWVAVIFFFILTTNVSAQLKLFLINPGQSIMQSIPVKDKYAYTEFVPGTVCFKKTKRSFERMNYNILLDEMQYINSRKDTIAIENSNVYFIVIANDTFFYNRFYYKVLKDYGKVRLIEKKSFGFVPRQKRDSQFYGYFQAFENGRFLSGITPKDTLRLAKFNLYYIADVKNQIWQLLTQNLLKFYPYREKELPGYLLEHPISVLNRAQVEALLDFLNAKQYN